MYDPDFFNDLYYLSIRIEKWMQIPVEIATISQTEEEKLNSTIRIPKSCYNTDTNMIFYLARGKKEYSEQNFSPFQRLSILFP